jgi:Xaa-Pro aminopeptidase
VNDFDGLKKLRLGKQYRKSNDVITALRLVKDEEEIEIIRKAVRLGDKLMKRVIDLVEPGISELEISRQIRIISEEIGATGESFSNIVASGPNSSRPHHHPTSRKLKNGDVLTIDLGVLYEGYCSDLTRTVVLGDVDPEFKEIYNVCLEANQQAIAALGPGKTGADVDAVARQIITDAGYGQFFGHGLGHGVGLEIHEDPRLNTRGTEYILEPGNIVTIEPGIYLPGKFGVRIEDYALVTEDGADVLSKVPKKLRSIPV